MIAFAKTFSILNKCITLNTQIYTFECTNERSTSSSYVYITLLNDMSCDMGETLNVVVELRRNTQLIILFYSLIFGDQSFCILEETYFMQQHRVFSSLGLMSDFVKKGGCIYIFVHLIVVPSLYYYSRGLGFKPTPPLIFPL